MKEQDERTLALIGAEKLQKLYNAKVFVAGLGGVGGYCAEALARAGIGEMIICDFDLVAESNINRQILALHSTVGKTKAVVSGERLTDINPNLNLSVVDTALTPENIPEIVPSDCIAVADCIDDVSAKIALIEFCKANDIYILSSMGTGNKLDPFRFRICDISKTSMDRLARAMRKKLRADGINKGIDVLFSDEEPLVGGGEEGLPAIPSISFMPAIAGNMIAGRIIQKILKKA